MPSIAPTTRDSSEEEWPSCRFCDLLLSDSPSRSETETILFESDRFVVWPSIGALVPGWTIIVSKLHVESMAQLDDAALRELMMIEESMRVSLQQAFRKPAVAFEHGPWQAGLGVGCGTDHAHLHMVPTDVDLISGAQAIQPDLEWRATDGWAGARDALTAQRSYILMRDPERGDWLATGSKLPSQLLRRSLAAEIGAPHRFDWKKNPELGNVRMTVEALKRPDRIPRARRAA